MKKLSKIQEKARKSHGIEIFLIILKQTVKKSLWATLSFSFCFEILFFLAFCFLLFSYHYVVVVNQLGKNIKHWIPILNCCRIRNQGLKKKNLNWILPKVYGTHLVEVFRIILQAVAWKFTKSYILKYNAMSYIFSGAHLLNKLLVELEMPISCIKNRTIAFGLILYLSIMTCKNN